MRRSSSASCRTSDGETLGHQLAGVQDVAAVGNVFEVSQVVGGGDYRLDAAGPFDQQIDELAVAARIERRRGLVEQQHRGVEDQHAGQGDLLLLAAGKAVRDPVLQVEDAEAVQNLVDALAALRPFFQRSCRGPKATSSNTVGLKS